MSEITDVESLRIEWANAREHLATASKLCWILGLLLGYVVYREFENFSWGLMAFVAGVGLPIYCFSNLAEYAARRLAWAEEQQEVKTMGLLKD